MKPSFVIRYAVVLVFGMTHFSWTAHAQGGSIERLREVISYFKNSGAAYCEGDAICGRNDKGHPCSLFFVEDPVEEFFLVVVGDDEVGLGYNINFYPEGSVRVKEFAHTAYGLKASFYDSVGNFFKLRTSDAHHARASVGGRRNAEVCNLEY